MRQEGEEEGEGGREGQPGPSRECVRRAEKAMVLEKEERDAANLFLRAPSRERLKNRGRE